MPWCGVTDVVLSWWQFLVSISKENSSAMEVLDSVAHSVRVKPENLRLAEVRVLMGCSCVCPNSHSTAGNMVTDSNLSISSVSMGWIVMVGSVMQRVLLGRSGGQGMSILPWRGRELSTASLWCCCPTAHCRAEAS